MSSPSMTTRIGVGLAALVAVRYLTRAEVRAINVSSPTEARDSKRIAAMAAATALLGAGLGFAATGTTKGAVVGGGIGLAATPVLVMSGAGLIELIVLVGS